MNESALRLDGIRAEASGKRILDGLDLAIGAGQVRALIGLNGAGKTTVLRVALGMIRPASGTVHVLGHDLNHADRSVWHRVGHMVESAFCYPELTPRQNIENSARLHGAALAPARHEALRLAEVLGLMPWFDTPARRLSLGSRQKVGLIAAMVHTPDLLLLDEPTNGLDPLAVLGFRTEIDAIARRGGSVLVTSHHFDELARISHTVDVLHTGRIIAEINPRSADLERTFFTIILTHDQTEGASA